MSSRCSSPTPLVADVLHELRLQDSYYCRGDFHAPWGIQVSARGCVGFHFVAEGSAWLLSPERMRLDAGDMVFLLRGPRHAFVSSPGVRVEAIESLPLEMVGSRSARLRHGGRGAATLVLCGGTSLDPPDHPIRELLPEVLVLRASDATQAAWTHLSISAMREEVIAPRLGSETFVTRLVELMLLEAIRAWLQRSDAKRGWLAALLDPQLGKVLALMHRQGDRPWTVQSLANEAGMSKSVFCERFRTLVGRPPLHYLAEVRMRTATNWLRSQRYSSAEIAQRLGYSSEAAFSRAFKRTEGRSPGEVRRQARLENLPGDYLSTAQPSATVGLAGQAPRTDRIGERRTSSTKTRSS